MTTSIRVYVNGRYRATVNQTYPDGRHERHVVEGNYAGSPNPSGEKHFYLSHPATSTLVISEEYIGDEVQSPSAEMIGRTHTKNIVRAAYE